MIAIGCYLICSAVIYRLICYLFGSGWHARVECGSRESPGVRGTFLCFAKEKYPKERRPHCLRPLRFATGQPAVLRFGGVSLNSRRCASLRHTRALIRQTLRSSAHPEGHGGQNIHTGHRCARPHIAGASATRRAGAAERSNGPNGCPAVRLFGCSAVPPLLAAPAAGRLRGEHGRRSAHASCSDSPWMSERSCTAAQ